VALASYAGRYAPVAGQAGISFPAAVAFDVAGRVPGGSATAFAAPDAAARSRRSPRRPRGRKWTAAARRGEPDVMPGQVSG
jgi:hypothetical protein